MRLALFLSFKASLTKWHREGILSREIQIYVRHLERGYCDEVVIFSYDPADHEALALVDCRPDIRARFRLVTPRTKATGNLSGLLHSLNLGLLWKLSRSGVSLSKTNQISGSWPALILRLFGVPLFARCGYLLSRRLFMNRQALRGTVALLIEAVLFNGARLVSVTTESAKAEISRLILWRKGKVFVAPTYVDTELFAPDPDHVPEPGTLIFVGRLEPQKNVRAIAEAVAQTGMALIMVGDGSERPAVEAIIQRTGARVTIIPRMQNMEISALFRQHRLFLLGSLHEGLPKVLIEAMSAGMVAIGSPIPGIVELVEDQRTGYLARSVAAEDLAEAIRRAMADQASHPAISAAARARILARHSLDTYATRENSEMRRAIGL